MRRILLLFLILQCGNGPGVSNLLGPHSIAFVSVGVWELRVAPCAHATPTVAQMEIEPHSMEPCLFFSL